MKLWIHKGKELNPDFKDYFKAHGRTLRSYGLSYGWVFIGFLWATKNEPALVIPFDDTDELC